VPSVVVCEAGAIGRGASRRAPGLVLPELLDPWGRVARSVAPERCEALFRFAASGAAWLTAFGGDAVGMTTPVWYVPGSRVEWDDLRATAELYTQWGLKHQMLDRRPPSEDGRLDLDAAALIVPEVLWVERGTCVQRMAATARAQGAEVCERRPVTALTTGDGEGVRLETPDGPIRAATVIVACGAEAARLVPALAGIVTPWRGEGMRARGVSLEHPVITNFGHEQYLPHELKPGRWEVEVAGLNPSPGPEDTTFDAKPTPKFQGFLESFTALRLNAPPGAGYDESWAALTSFTPDRLPVVGALPGRPEIRVSSGYHARGLSWGVAAGVALARQLRGLDLEPPIPDELSPGRFVPA
jgi:D-amino-acid dehydrogenase